jgi:hypothetical protein
MQIGADIRRFEMGMGMPGFGPLVSADFNILGRL